VSKTSIAIFDECQRKWAYTYQWWDLPEDVRLDFSYEAKLMPLEAFAGQVVDDVITETLRGFDVAGWQVDFRERAHVILKQYLDASEIWFHSHLKGLKPPQLDRQPLDRYYFREALTADEKQRLRDGIVNSLENFWNSSLPERIAAVDRRFWKVPEHGLVPWFLSDGVPVWAKYDFAIVQPGSVHIFDWKTGKVHERSEFSARTQLHTYAAYAISEWKADAGEIELHAVWLSAGPDQMQSMSVHQGLLRQLRAQWRERHQLLRERLAQVSKDPARLLDLFPMTGIETGKCARCQFRSCEGYARLAAGEPASPPS
jgi:hypothetical protein